LEVFYEGNAGEEGYGQGFVEERLERITYDEPGEEGS
jgi:hypothetical protein